MPIKIRVHLEFGTTMYLKDDMEQLPHTLVGILVLPGSSTGASTGTSIKFRLSYMGEIIEVYDFEASTERDMGMFPTDETDNDSDEDGPEES